MGDSRIRLYGDPVLRRKCSETLESQEYIEHLIKTMSRIMYVYKGIGLAAPQIGVLERIIIADVGEGLHSFINPKILWQQGKESMKEGCLSIPGIFFEIKRSKEIVIEAFSERGEKTQYGAQGLLSRVLQHEIDHLDGIMIIDRVHKKKLKTVKKQLMEISKGKAQA